jgi:hypothetical protein
MEQDTNGSGFASAIGTEVPEDLATLDIKVNIKYTPLLAVELGQSFSADDAIINRHSVDCFPEL